VYTAFFGLKENPFNLTPDPRYLFLSPHHKEALDHLLYGINERKGFIAIVGGIGTGKTTLCRALLSRLDQGTKSALIFNAYISDMELLQAINQEFGLEESPGAKSKKDYIDTLNQFLLDTFSAGGNAVLLIDEAQNLSQEVLEQIRMLSNLETEREKLIQIVLVGQPELRELLATPSLRQLDERIMVRYELKPLEPKDLAGYVEHRLVVAGARGNLKFSDRALARVYAYSRGNPRRINSLCDRALLIAYAEEKFTVSRGLVERAIKDLRGDGAIHPVTRGLGTQGVHVLILVLVLAVFLAGFFGWTYRRQMLGFLLPQEKAAPLGRVPAPAPRRETKAPSLFLEEKASLSALFGLAELGAMEGDGPSQSGDVTLVSMDIGPEYHVMFKKPFRVRSSQGTNPAPAYLVVAEVTQGGALVIDAAGKKQEVKREFLISHWGGRISWPYLPKGQDKPLIQGMRGPDVLEVQKLLEKIGYLAEPTGVYDQPTYEEVMRLQRNVGLRPDGIVGPRTRAILYLMSD